MSRRSGERAPPDRSPSLSRRQFNSFAFWGSLALRTAAYNTLVLGGKTILFRARAPSAEQRRARATPANLGNLAELVREHSVCVIDAGDSEGKGWTDIGWTLTPAGLTFVNDSNQLCKRLNIPRPRITSTEHAPYFENQVIAQSGATIAQIRQQIADFRAAALLRPASNRAYVLHLSAGGNDAIQYLLAHANPTGITTIIDDFTDQFLPNLAREYELLLREVAALKEVPALSGLRHIYATGLPDLGVSNGMGIMNIPGVRGIATAACQYIDEEISLAVERVSSDADVGIHYIDTFTDPAGDTIEVGRLHLTHDGYTGVGRNLEAGTLSDLPSGGVQNLYNACVRHGVFHARYGAQLGI